MTGCITIPVMVTNQLPISTSSNGSLGSTAAPQQSVPANSVSGGTPASIQPGNGADSLNNASAAPGVPLQANKLTTVNIGNTTPSTSSAAQPIKQKNHPVLLGFSITLFIIAIGLFWYMAHDAKKTTKKYK